MLVLSCSLSAGNALFGHKLNQRVVFQVQFLFWLLPLIEDWLCNLAQAKSYLFFQKTTKHIGDFLL
jgi:hypothetical protein